MLSMPLFSILYDQKYLERREIENREGVKRNKHRMIGEGGISEIKQINKKNFTGNQKVLYVTKYKVI